MTRTRTRRFGAGSFAVTMDQNTLHPLRKDDEGMSISRDFDAYCERNNITPSDEVVPEDACQVFTGEVAGEDSEAAADRARRRVEKLLND